SFCGSGVGMVTLGSVEAVSPRKLQTTSQDRLSGDAARLAENQSLLPQADSVNDTIRAQALVDATNSCRANAEDILFRLAFLITGDQAQAEDSIIRAYELAEQGEMPFRERQFECANCATVRSAIQSRLADIRECKDLYESSDCKQPKRRPQVIRPELQATTESILHLDPEMVITELDPLARAILVLRGVLRASVRDCSIQFNMSSKSVLAVQGRITAGLLRRSVRRSRPN